MLDNLFTHDLSGGIAALSKHKGYSVLAPRTTTAYITFHYSAVDYTDRSESAELQRILDEATYQLRHNYGDANEPRYPDGLLYDCVVLSSGAIVRTRSAPVQLWHCGNATGNAQSYAAHVMLGPNQDMTTAQKEALYRVFDAVRAAYGIPRQNVIAHCEWPRTSGLPVRSQTYRLLPKQSACPGKRLFPIVPEYRNMSDNPFINWGTAYPIVPEQRAWAIPQTWLSNQWLRAATGNEQYIDPNTSVQPFEEGLIVFEKVTGRAFTVKRNG